MGRLDPVISDPVGFRRPDHVRIEGIQDRLFLGSHQFLVGDHGCFGDAVSVVEQDAHVANPPHARVRAGRRLPGLHPWKAQDALLGFARGPVVINLLIRAGCHAHTPGAALVFVDQNHPILLALVDCTGGAGRYAGRVQAVVADAWQVVEDHSLQLMQLRLNARGNPLQVGVVVGVDLGAAQVVVPVWPGFDVHGFAGDHRDRNSCGLIIPSGGVEQILVAEGERLVVIFQVGQRRVEKQVEQPFDFRVQAQPQIPIFQFPSTVVMLLVLPLRGIAGAGPGLDVVPPHIFCPLAVGPQVLAGHGTGMAADAFIQVKEHAHVCAYVHSLFSIRALTCIP